MKNFKNLTTLEILNKIEDLSTTYSIIQFKDYTTNEDDERCNKIEEEINNLKNELKSRNTKLYYYYDGSYYLSRNASLCFSTDKVYFLTEEEANTFLKNAIMDEQDKKKFVLGVELWNY